MNQVSTGEKNLTSRRKKSTPSASSLIENCKLSLIPDFIWGMAPHKRWMAANVLVSNEKLHLVLAVWRDCKVGLISHLARGMAPHKKVPPTVRN